jgi:hypothetical protein
VGLSYVATFFVLSRFNNAANIVLDPRIGYEGLKREASRNLDSDSSEDYLLQVNVAKESLTQFFLDNYITTEVTTNHSHVPSPPHSTPRRFDFYGVYADTEEDLRPTAELEKLFSHKPLGFARRIAPIQWWKTNLDFFPNVSRLARDILGIPGECSAACSDLVHSPALTGSSVAVERIFSGGRDTISLRRASLKPETVRTLMLVKHKLLLARRTLDSEVQGSFLARRGHS